MPIPEELTAYQQWVVWKYATTPEGKTTKLPYSPVTGQLASVNDPSTWSTYAKAVEALSYKQHAGLGFVLSDNDPYSFIDLDNPKGDQGIISLQVTIAETFDTYAEVSPSGYGLHLIVKGSVPDGRRRNCVEVYSSHRYMTVTGNPYQNKPIAERQQLLEQLWKELGGVPTPGSAAVNQEQQYTDEEIYTMACNARNGQKFDRLFHGQWEGYYPSQSEADFALINIISFYSRNTGQIRRLFLASELGKRDKANKRKGYVDDMIRKSFDNVVPAVEASALVEKVKQEIVAKGIGFKDARPRIPILKDAAMHGLAGQVVNTILPHSEADKAALLLHFLAGYGSVIGRKSYCQVESTRHYSNIFFACVGETAKGRKGTAWNRVRDILARIDPLWALERIQSGLSSGEGLIAAVADHDGAATDRRLFVVQAEFASTLKVMAREGNTLSPLIREAWDSGSLRTLVKRDPLHVEDAHISIVAHITRDELRRCLTLTESANGFANRILWARSVRSKCLPEGGSLSDRELDALAVSLRPAVEFGRVARLLRRDDAARKLWAKVYPELSDGQPGLLGAVTSRAEAQVLRLSMLYALLDCSDEIRVPHLEAARAVWDYCEKSARWIFGDALGDPVADTILSGLRGSRDKGLTRSQISGLFERHRAAAEIEAALCLLQEKGLAHSESSETAGRSAEVWFIGLDCERSEGSVR
jgi:hypothetical protein